MSLLTFVASCIPCIAQVANFNAPAATCINGNILLENTSTGALSYEWDFCHDALKHPQTPVLVKTITETGLPFGLEVVYDQGNWFGFLTGYSTRKILRLSFGNDLTSIPVVDEISSAGGGQIKLIQSGNDWFGIAIDISGTFIRLSFGNSLSNTPTISDLGNLGWSGVYGLDLVIDNANYIVILADYGSNVLRFVHFGSSITNNPAVGDVTTVATGNALISGPSRIELIQSNGSWFGIMNSLNNNKVLFLQFGTTLISEPIISSIADVSSPAGLSLVKDGLNYFAIVSSADGSLRRFEFSDTLSDTPVVTNLTNFSLLEVGYALSLVKDGVSWKLFQTGFYNSGLTRQSYLDQCTNVSPLTSSQTAPQNLKYTLPGKNIIELIARASNGELSRQEKEILVNPQQAPQVTINAVEKCVDVPVQFSFFPTGSVDGWEWNFDDGSTSTTASPQHTFSQTGTYNVSVNVSSSGCVNRIFKTIELFNAPQADFNLPSVTPLCTNEIQIFNNISTFDIGSSPEWQWFVNGISVSTAEDLSHAFINATSNSVKLVSNLTGCIDEIEKQMPALVEGPLVNFSFIGICVGVTTSFQSNISGVVENYLWEFGDNTTNTDPDTQHLFPAAGSYSVKLVASSPNGCNNSAMKMVTIYSKPQIDFDIPDPPLSCSGSPVTFINQTLNPPDSNIESWFWNFNDLSPDNSSSSENPSHTFGAGSYNVSLTAITSEGCTESFQKLITIPQSPAVAIQHSPTCSGVPVNFTAIGDAFESHYWEIGTSYYTISNPIHTFNAPGNYPLKLTVRGNNNCEAIVSKAITVPVPLVPDFSISKNCVGQQAAFTDITTGTDPVVIRSWNFAGLGNATGSPATFQFNTIGNRSVTMNVTTQAGCNYARTKTVSIVEPPIAGFTATPEIGASPLPVQFANTSTGATLYQWDFGDGNSSTSATPTHTYSDLGSYVAELTAISVQGCESSFSKAINVIVPHPDVVIKTISLTENGSGSAIVIITLENKGNSIIKDLPLDIDLSGRITLREVIEESLAPSSLYNLVLSYSIPNIGNFSFLCAAADLENDVAPESNRLCIELNDKIFFFTPYPNPVSGNLSLEWVAPDGQPVEISLHDSMGKIAFIVTAISESGLNGKTYDVSNLRTGIYTLSFKTGNISKAHRIFVLGEN